MQAAALVDDHLEGCFRAESRPDPRDHRRGGYTGPMSEKTDQIGGAATIAAALLTAALWGFNFTVIKVGVAGVPPILWPACVSPSAPSPQSLREAAGGALGPAGSLRPIPGGRASSAFCSPPSSWALPPA
jgi:hypothetical protein